MADHVNVNVKNPAKGSADVNGPNETELKIKNLAKRISKPKNSDASLDEVNAVVGKPKEIDVPIKDLIFPPQEWSELFKKAGDEDIQKMAASIYRYGLLHRVTLWQRKDGKFIILGGMTRVAAYKYLNEIYRDKNWAKIPARVYSAQQLDKIDAQRIFIISNTDQRQMSVKSVAYAYYQLVKLERERAFYGSGIYSRVAAAKQAGVSLSSFNNYLKLTELYPALLDMVDKNRLQLSAAYELAYAPANIQKYIFDKEYYINLKRKTAKQIAKEAKKFSDVDAIINGVVNEKPTFKYRVNVSAKLPDNCEVLPIFVDREFKTDIVDALRKAVDELDIPDEAKTNLFKALKS